MSAGCTTYDHAEASTNAALVQRAARTLVVADASKLGHAGFARICDVSAVHLIITDDSATDEQLVPFAQAGVAVERVERESQEVSVASIELDAINKVYPNGFHAVHDLT